MYGRDRRLQRRLRRFYAVTAILYALLGLLFIQRAMAQTRVPVSVYTNDIEPVPTGNDDETVMRYYDYLYLRHLRNFQETYFTNPLLLSWVYGVLGAGLLVIYAFTFGWYSRRLHHDLYPVEVYNGYIAERGGPVDPFNWAVYGVLLAYMAYYTVTCVVFGQQY